MDDIALIVAWIMMGVITIVNATVTYRAIDVRLKELLDELEEERGYDE